jgi:hypothetical protein
MRVIGLEVRVPYLTVSLPRVFTAVKLILAGVFSALSIACASKPVEVTTGAMVSLDTTRRVAARVRKPAPVRSFWGAMTNLDPDYVVTHQSLLTSESSRTLSDW